MERSNDLSSPKIALLIDFDNVILGIDDPGFDVQLVVNALRERGQIVLGRCYGDWYRHSRHRRNLMEHGLELVETPAFGPVIKNSADIRIALDGYEIGMTQHHIDTFCIVSGDSDFLPLIKKLQFLGKRVLVICGSRFTSDMVRRNCNEFISYENLLAASVGATEDATTLDGAFALVERAMTALREAGRDIRTSTLKQMMLQLNPVFSERSFGCSQFRYFLDKAVAKKLVKYGPRDRTSGELHVLLPDEDEAPLVEKFEARARKFKGESAKIESAKPEAKDPKTEALSEDVAPDASSETPLAENAEAPSTAATARAKVAAPRTPERTSARAEDDETLYPRYDRNARRAERRYGRELPARPLASASAKTESTPAEKRAENEIVSLDETSVTSIIAPLDHIASDAPTPEDLQENLLTRSELSARGLRRGKLKFSAKSGGVISAPAEESRAEMGATPQIEAPSETLEAAPVSQAPSLEIETVHAPVETETTAQTEAVSEAPAEEKPKKRAPRRRSSAKKTDAKIEEIAPAETASTEAISEVSKDEAPPAKTPLVPVETAVAATEEAPAKPKRARRTTKKAPEAAPAAEVVASEVAASEAPEKPKRKAAPRKRVAKKAE